MNLAPTLQFVQQEVANALGGVPVIRQPVGLDDDALLERPRRTHRHDEEVDQALAHSRLDGGHGPRGAVCRNELSAFTDGVQEARLLNGVAEIGCLVTPVAPGGTAFDQVDRYLADIGEGRVGLVGAERLPVGHDVARALAECGGEFDRLDESDDVVAPALTGANADPIEFVELRLDAARVVTGIEYLQCGDAHGGSFCRRDVDR